MNQWYAVVAISDGQTIAVTRDLEAAAVMLEGDVCHAAGYDYKAAVANARAVARDIREWRNELAGRNR